VREGRGADAWAQSGGVPLWNSLQKESWASRGASPVASLPESRVATLVWREAVK
jgi:hypothetical protein